MQVDEQEDQIGLFFFFISGEHEMQAGDKNVRWTFFIGHWYLMKFRYEEENIFERYQTKSRLNDCFLVKISLF